MRNKKSIFLTFLFTLIILGAGYLGIVEQGKEILRSESVPERAEYKNAGSNIFYGKIDDDIEIFPWNYYPENDEKEEIIPNFIMDDGFVGDLSEHIEEIEQIIQETEGITDLQAGCYIAADAYFAEMISFETGVDKEEVLEYFRKPGNHMLQNMVMSSDSYVGAICFYQEILTLGGRRYQIRIACSDWNVINFVCTEYNTKDKREQAEWKAGKKEMVGLLEQSGDALSRYFTYMSQLNDLGAPAIYLLDEERENAYLVGMQYLKEIMSGMGNKEWTDTEERKYLEMKIDMVSQEWKAIYQGTADDVYLENSDMSVDGKEGAQEKGVEPSDAEVSGQEVEYSVNYSYQVVELKDMILLLVQGDVTMGLYFDPINRKFCGYNFLYEY